MFVLLSIDDPVKIVKVCLIELMKEPEILNSRRYVCGLKKKNSLENEMLISM